MEAVLFSGVGFWLRGFGFGGVGGDLWSKDLGF